VRIIDALAWQLSRELRIARMARANDGAALLAAARCGRGKDVRSLLCRGDARRPEALLCGATGGHVAVVVSLLTLAGAAFTGTHLGDALSASAGGGHVAVVRELIASGANVHYLDGRPLLWAAMRGHEEVVKALLDAGADAGACGGAVRTWAAQHGHVRVAALLDVRLE
jgi:ankyrin repeat protein